MSFRTPRAGPPTFWAAHLAQKLGTSLKTTVVVDNKAGATGGIGSTFVARAAPDGNTILGTSIGPMAIVPSLKSNLQYDPVKSFEPVAIVGTIPHVLIVSAAKSLSVRQGRCRSRQGQARVAHVRLRR